ncbi:MAG: glycosyltransferase family 2 protein [Deltaproteobacteria bacterium]|nr:glycosyltransferase family 2 protein [Deltaproteobacteria bacterium]
MSRPAVVVIGRNEGVRLARCLDAIEGAGAVVYVDSGSSDGSPALARRRGASVVELDPAQPFTAARARNAGLDRALELQPGAALVQFLDGDCELLPGWLEAGARELKAGSRVAVACGEVRERERERSIYNRLCDLEWRAAPGPALACGGNALVRVEAFRQAGGFAPDLIAGEEPELCLRLRRLGWGVVRVAVVMVLHDADMTRFGQWWRRAVRAGWAYAEGAALHGAGPERHWVRESRSILFWGLAVPGSALLLAWPTGGLSLLLLAGWAALLGRIYLRAVRAGDPPRDAALLACFTVLAKLPQAVGQLRFLLARALGRRRRLVDWRVTP